jgi:hypothetical protein
VDFTGCLGLRQCEMRQRFDYSASGSQVFPLGNETWKLPFQVLIWSRDERIDELFQHVPEQGEHR